MFKDWGACVVNGVPTLNCITVIFENIIRAALLFSGIVALFFIIISGIKLVTSGGDPKQVEAAKKTLTFAIIGLVIVLLSFFIVSIIGYITGVECINQFGFNNCQ